MLRDPNRKKNVEESVDATSLNKMKKFNPSKYRFLKKMLSPHKNSLQKLVNANMSIEYT